MANPHSSVIYVEPNSMDYDWNSDKTIEKASRLEDYCIALNIEVEVCSRNKYGKDTEKKVILLSWDNNKDKVSFMSGTKIGGYQYGNEGGRPVRTPKIKDSYNALTTYYADMYVGDLVDYGTTEMVGIKSVNIEYVKNCVPMITVQFTDVRGLSLFQPTELSRDNSYNGIKGLTQSNIAQSFFQCFYKMPLPKFTIYVKGFYGEPVSYEMMCDKFDSDFNSENGNFDCTAHFVGYSYSFMTDVSLDALIVAPYSDYEGSRYWKDKVDSGEFYVWDKTHTFKMPMPTLYEVKSKIEQILLESDKDMEGTTLSEEEKTHEDEIQKLRGIKGLYENWYTSLFSLVQEKYGKRYCFLFKENGEDGCYYRIIILTNKEDNKNSDLSFDFEQYSSEFKQLNKNLFSAISDFNDGNKSFELKNISQDFKEYTRQALFNNCYVNASTRKIEFGGFNKECKLPKKEIISNLFNEKADYTLSTIYGDGVKQNIDGYVIDVDYSEIKRRINILIRDASRDVDDKTKENAIRVHNQNMFGKMNWYPTVENFTRIVLAHLETLMAMMYKVSSEIKERTTEDLGVDYTDLADVNKEDRYIPPFPRVTKTVIGDDGISKLEDSWVGDLTKGEGFKEVEIIDGIFNAVEILANLEKRDREIMESINRVNNEGKKKVKYPITPFDFFINKDLYGSELDLTNNVNAFAAKVAIRMYAILALNTYSKFYDAWNVSSLVNSIAESEAINFYNSVKLTSRKLFEILGTSDDNGALNADSIIKLMIENKSIDGQPLPWGERPLFNRSMELTLYRTENSSSGEKTTIYPIQDISFSKLNETYEYFNSGKMQVENEDIALNFADASFYENILKSSNNSVFNTIYLEEDFNSVKTKFEDTMENADESYKKIYEIISDNVGIDEKEFSTMVSLSNSCFAQKKKTIRNHFCVTTSNNTVNNSYSIDGDGLLAYASQAVNGTIEDFTLTEAYGWKKENGIYSLDYNKAFFNSNNKNKSMLEKMAFFVMSFDCINYESVKESLKNKAFNYVPKLAALQMGAILSIVPWHSLKDNARKYLPISDNEKSILPYLFGLSTMGKMVYVKYFNKWANNNYPNVENLLKTENGEKQKNINFNYSEICGYNKDTATSSGRCIFNETSSIVSNLTNAFMLPLLVVNASIFHTTLDAKTVKKNIDTNIAKTYLDTFLEKLRMLYGNGYLKDEDGNVTKITETPKNTTKDMKKELYRYLKLLYDKWIPNYTLDDWNYELFFKYDDDLSSQERKGVNGHRFHFIDSYYNKIGDKLLINPVKLGEKLSAAFLDNNGDVSVMMLGFMADIYAQNKCMLLSLHNFMDFGVKDAMNKMFKPISFNEMTKPRKHPDFVVVYPYEPSKHLNVDNAEYENDGFMLNEESETPIAIRSRGQNSSKYYQIPAFGVTYGKQYQNYFKRVTVNTKSPIATQQSIMAKHSILRNINNGKPSGVVGQDLYDIYTTQSYTCTVEMMGCAWVQPLMYFVLLNVPMFRGSYMIFKVTHRITPGDMTTTFMGTRMGNVANTLVEDIFTDDSDMFGAGQMYVESSRNRNANIDNDCPYKVYPLEEDETIFVEMTSEQLNKGKELMNSVIDVIYDGNVNESTKIAAAGIVGNMFAESTLNYLSINEKDKGFLAGGLCQWNDRYYNLTNLLDKKTKNYGQKEQEKNSLKKDKVLTSLKKLTENYQIEFLRDTINKVTVNRKSNVVYSKDKLLEASTPSNAAMSFEAAYERSDGTTNNKRKGAAEKLYKYYNSGTSNDNKTNADDKKLNKTDVRTLFFNALTKSCKSTNAISGNITRSDAHTSNSNKKVLVINGTSDDLAVVFDIILNGYYDHVQTLWWSYEKDFSEKPSLIYVEPSMKVNSGRKIFVVKGNDLRPTNAKFSKDANEQLLRALSKKYANVEDKYLTEIPQLDERETLNTYKAANCDEVVGRGKNTTARVSNPLPKNSIIKSKNRAKYKDWNVHNAVQHLVTHVEPISSGKCAAYVENAIEAGGIPRPYTSEIDKTETAKEATRLRYQNILKNHGFVEKYSGMVQPHSTPQGNYQAGDIAIIGEKGANNTYPPNYHACMFNGEIWISDFVQKSMSPYDKAYPYAVFRYQDNQITTV